MTCAMRCRRRELLGRVEAHSWASHLPPLGHISQQAVLTSWPLSSQAGDHRDMSRELQDVDLAEVKPLVEKGEVSGDAPDTPISHAHSHMGMCVHNDVNTCTHTHMRTHVSTASLFSTGHLVREYLFKSQLCHQVLWHYEPGPLPTSLGFWT